MKKKIAGLMIAGVAVFALSGCGGGGDDYYEPPVVVVDMHYLIDSFGDPVPGVSYDCLSGEHGVTDPEGGYYFDPRADSCDFYLVRIADDLHIENESFVGLNGIPYRCDSINGTLIGFTGDYIGAGGFAGGFDHDWHETDVCTLDY